MYSLKNIRLSIVILIIVAVKSKAQQLPEYTNYIVNNYVMNPAIGGSNSTFEAISTSRYQWVGITDAPRTYMLSVNGPTKSLNVGIGGTVFTDNVGPTRRTGFSLSYAYHLKVAEKIKVSLGLSAGMLQYMVDGSQIQLQNPNDLVVTNGVQSVLIPDFGVGIYTYSTDKKWYIGASVPQIIQNQSKISSSPLLVTLDRHYYITGGYKFKLSDDYKLEPSTCIQYVTPAPLQFDIGLRLIYRDIFWIGTVYRSQDAVAAMVGFIMKGNFTLAYSYDYTTSNLGKYSTGTHELNLGFKFHK